MVHFQYTFEDLKYKTPLEARLEGLSEVPSGGLKADLRGWSFRHLGCN